MKSEWTVSKLSDACSAINYGLTASAVADRVGPRFLRITDIVSGPIDWSTVPYVEVDDVTMEKYRIRDGDIVLARTGASTGASCYIDSPPPAVFASYLVRLRVHDNFDPRFVAYYLKGDRFRSFIYGVLGDKSAQPNASASTMSQAPLFAPKSKVEQAAIAHVLGTLDDKIELNRRMNKTLEEMARALFKSWFVDFDPVRAKMEGRWRPSESLPGLPSHLYDLFPNRLVASELGQIPEGWEVKPLGEDFEITMGQSPPGNTYNQIRTGLPFYQGSTDFGFRFPRRRVYCTGPTRLAQRGDSLVSVRAPVGDLNMALEQCCVGRGVASVRHRSDSRSFTYYAMQALRTSFRLFEAEGTVFGALTSKDFQAMLRVSPPDKMVAFFDAWCSPLDRHIEVNERASLLLAAQRDSLLPQLVSGELRLENWEGDNT